MSKVREGTIALKDIVIDPEYLSRELETRFVNEFAEAMINGDVFPPIHLEEQTNKLLRGLHRTKAYAKYAKMWQEFPENAESEDQLDIWPEPLITIPCEWHIVPKGWHPCSYASRDNKHHGNRQTVDQNRKVCQRQYKAYPGSPFKLMMDATGLSERTIRTYLGDLLHEFEQTRSAAIQRLSFLGWTQEEMAEALKRVWPEGEVSQVRVSQILKESGKLPISFKNDYGKNVSISTLSKRSELPELIVWALVLEGKTDEDRLKALDISIQPYDTLHFSGSDDRFGTADYPGRIPAQLIAHVLHWFTKPGDTVLDPMAGGGTVPDVCLVMGRACYAYDINTSPRIDILPHDMALDGWPDRLKKADLIFWDPPYFAKKDDGYPEGSISRLDRTRYLTFFEKAFADAKAQAKKGARLAFLMSDWNDHEGKQPGIFLWDYADLLRQAGWTLLEHIQAPLSTQQVHPDIVTKFRQSGRRARLERYLLIAKA